MMMWLQILCMVLLAVSKTSAIQHDYNNNNNNHDETNLAGRYLDQNAPVEPPVAAPVAPPLVGATPPNVDQAPVAGGGGDGDDDDDDDDDDDAAPVASAPIAPAPTATTATDAPDTGTEESTSQPIPTGQVDVTSAPVDGSGGDGSGSPPSEPPVAAGGSSSGSPAPEVDLSFPTDLPGSSATNTPSAGGGGGGGGDDDDDDDDDDGSGGGTSAPVTVPSPTIGTSSPVDTPNGNDVAPISAPVAGGGDSDGDGDGGSDTQPTPFPTFERPTFPVASPVFVPPTPQPSVKYVASDDDPIKDIESDDQISTTDDAWQWTESTIDEMEHDKNVIIALSVVFGTMFLFSIFVAHQMLHNPQGCCASICRITVACICAVLRCVCYPCRAMCGCTSARQPDHMIVPEDGHFTHDLELS